MKRKLQFFCSFILFVSVLICLTSCSSLRIAGIKNFHPDDSETGLTKLLIPDGFLETYPYIDGGYDYYDYKTPLVGEEIALIYMKYEEEIYREAKSYALEQGDFIADSEITYKGYVFNQRERLDSDPQNRRIYFAYSDEQHILLAIGTDPNPQGEFTYPPFESYIETCFPFYNFETGKIER